MKVEIIMPQMGESIAEATIIKWFKRPGDQVLKDEILLEISTDKVDSEIPSPSSGLLYDVFFDAGEVVPVKTPIAVIETNETNTADQELAAPASAEQAPAYDPPTQTAAALEEPLVSSSSTPPVFSNRFYSPLVKNLAAKYAITFSELDMIPGSGQGGRLTKLDLLNYIQRDRRTPSATSAPEPAHLPALNDNRRIVDTPSSQIQVSVGESTAIPMDHMRKIISERMLHSLQTSAHVHSIHEVDMTKVSRWRADYLDEFQAREGFRINFTPFFLEAAAKALLEFPYLNSTIEGDMIVLRRHVNLGCAVALEGNGLIVPVIKKAEEKNLVGLARQLNDLGHRARHKSLSPDETAGGTFTVTNAGGFGTLIGTPIINQPQVAILCVGRIQKRPVVIDDLLGIREMCYLTLSYDHRIIDGMMAGRFLSFLSNYLEHWDLSRPLY
ncbi:MAG: 2-oxo acid dehydrogenase subunit E2 [Deltaproteobacteria bacterium]|nr:2-oxo acid dehydrogenase subunit E2 [Deltaproteobacteria bacterium]